ncbi:MAG: hypothetical protein ACOC2V_02955 [Alkalispirochaeta sp.]
MQNALVLPLPALMAVVPVLFLFGGCGLPSIPVLEAPVNPGISTIDSPGLQILTFDHNRNNDFDDFKGYDLYYKLYPPAGSVVDSSISGDESYIETVPKDTGPGRLQERGFMRLVPVTNRAGEPESILSTIEGDSIPSIPFAPTDEGITFSLDLREPPNRPDGSVDRDAEEADLVVSWGDGGTSARGFRRRSATGSSSQPTAYFDGFWYGPGYDLNDYDISRMFGSSFDLDAFNNQITLVIYAVTYGVDTDFQPYYSEPLRLREATIVVSDS